MSRRVAIVVLAIILLLTFIVTSLIDDKAPDKRPQMDNPPAPDEHEQIDQDADDSLKFTLGMNQYRNA